MIKNHVDGTENMIRADVFVVLESCDERDRQALAEWIATKRPDLSEEVSIIMSEIETDSLEDDFMRKMGGEPDPTMRRRGFEEGCEY